MIAFHINTSENARSSEGRTGVLDNPVLLQCNSLEAFPNALLLAWDF
jgi:hypothetical protein